MVMTMMFEDEDESMRTIPIAMTLALSSKESEYELLHLILCSSAMQIPNPALRKPMDLTRSSINAYPSARQIHSVEP